MCYNILVLNYQLLLITLMLIQMSLVQCLKMFCQIPFLMFFCPQVQSEHLFLHLSFFVPVTSITQSDCVRFWFCFFRFGYNFVVSTVSLFLEKYLVTLI